MVITRKIEIFVCEDDKDLRKEYYEKLYENRKYAVKAANLSASVMYMLDTNMACMDEKTKELVTFIGVKGDAATKKNAPYVVCSHYFKGQADMGMISCVIQNVQKMYQDDRKKGMWEKSLRSYKANMPVPFKADRFLNLRFEKYQNGNGEEREGCFFTLIGIPFQIRFGRDKSGNKCIISRILSQRLFDMTNGREGEYTGYKMCTSSIAIEKKFDPETEKKKQKIFLYLCVDIPKKEVEVDPKNVVYCYLGIAHPIQCLIDSQCDDIYSKDARWLTIGTAEEFVHRRRQIQEAIRRCQRNCKYNQGGKGRKRKMQALNRYEEKEKNYVDTKLHMYSKLLVKLAVDHGCGTICLVNQKPREDMVKIDNQKGEPLLLRNWSYYGLKQKIQYKCKLHGIAVKELGKTPDDETSENG
jgi:IS605 OrfB family transposase